MQIHDLNTKSLTDPAYVAFDDGTDTYKVEFNDTVESAAQAAVAEADLTQNTVGFTSGDSLSPSGWTSVSQITTDSTLATLFNRISTMVKNVRYIWNLLGSSSFSNVARTLTGAIGNTALKTTAQTLSGAIAEHESDISTLNSKLTAADDRYYNVSTLAELKAALADMLSSKYQLTSLQVCQLRTLDMSDTSILQRGVYTCLCYRTSDLFGSILLYCYGVNKLYVIARANTEYFVHTFTGSTSPKWTL